MENQFIPGIYNYCDRWCERCYFTSRCRTWQQTGKFTSEQQDINNKAFWDNLSKNFTEALALLHKAAAELPIDPDNILQEEYAGSATLIEQTPLTALCKQYSTRASLLLQNNLLFREKEHELIQQYEMGLTTEQPNRELLHTIKSCVEVIQWYLHFMYVKFMRAQHSRLEDDAWAEQHGFQKDGDGSAKVALIAVERSVHAWLALHRLLPAHADNILTLLALLEKIKKAADKEFPNARSFIRPGFDEEEQYAVIN